MKNYIKKKFFKKKFFTKYFRYITSPCRVLPDFIIIGASRSGTTSFYNYLIDHPYIEPAVYKEVRFFWAYFNRGVNYYKKFFPTVFHKIYHKYVLRKGFLTFETSPYYMYHPHAVKRIYSMLPNVKLIIILRNPIDRAFSQYNGMVSSGYEKLTFEEAIKIEEKRLEGELEKIINNEFYYSFNHRQLSYLTSGIYIDQIKKIREFFPKEQILIINSEEFFNNPPKILKEVFKFLNIPDHRIREYKKYHSKTLNKKINAKTRNYLIDYFKLYNQQLYKYLGRAFDWDK
ncbi:MAG: sulfotransferase [Promethearchaeota archaeon]